MGKRPLLLLLLCLIFLLTACDTAVPPAGSETAAPTAQPGGLYNIP